MFVTRRLEFDAGHRIPNHESKCRHLHGHRYALEITLSGDIIADPGTPVEGMVMDFSKIKALAKAHLVDQWDHAFLAYRGDTAVIEFLKTIHEHRTIILDCIPTAENLARHAFDLLDPIYGEHYGKKIRLERIRRYETPNCWADAVRSGSQSR